MKNERQFSELMAQKSGIRSNCLKSTFLKELFWTISDHDADTDLSYVPVLLYFYTLRTR